MCFSLRSAYIVAARERKSQRGCWRCLRTGRFLISHETEIGYVCEAGLHLGGYPGEDCPLVGDLDTSPRPVTLPNGVVFDGLRSGSLPGLLRTPGYTTWQGERWLTHCQDFMVYLGEWKPAGFQQRAHAGDGRALFLQMTGGGTEAEFLWPEGEPDRSDWYGTCHAFRCRHCAGLRAHLDTP
jgi:hypothetical protein